VSILYRFPAICQKSPILTHPTCIWRHRRGWPPSNFAEIFGNSELESLGDGAVLLCDPTFSRFSITPTCDRQTVRHRQTQTQTNTGLWLVPRMHSIARYKLQNYKIVELIPFQLLTRGKVLSWEYRSPRKRNSRPPASVILCWVRWVENVLLIYWFVGLFTFTYLRRAYVSVYRYSLEVFLCFPVFLE